MTAQVLPRGAIEQYSFILMSKMYCVSEGTSENGIKRLKVSCLEI